jgi:hypothetical protein
MEVHLIEREGSIPLGIDHVIEKDKSLDLLDLIDIDRKLRLR